MDASKTCCSALPHQEAFCFKQAHRPFHTVL